MSEELADLYVTLRTNHAGYLSGISSVTEASSAGESALTGMSTALVTMGGAFAAAGAAAAAYSVSSAISFDAALAKTQALAGASADEIAALHDQILTLSGDVAQAPIDLANALYFVESSGIHGAAAMDVLRESSMAATAGLGSLTTVTDAVTSIMNAYGNSGMTAKTATDTLVAAVTQGKVPADDLAGALGRILGQSSALGISLPEVVSNIAALTRQGQSASQAATSLQSIESALVKMLDPSQKVSDSLKALGLTGQQVNDDLKNKGLRATLQEIVDATNGNNDALVTLFPNIRALRDILGTSATQGDQYASILANIQSATDGAGRTADAFGVTQQTVAFKLDQAKTKLQALAVTFGEWLIPYLKDGVHWLESMWGWLQRHDDVMHALAAGGLALVTAGFIALGVAVLAATWEFAAVTLIIAGFTAAAVYAWTHCKTLRDVVGELGRIITSVTAPAVQVLSDHSDGLKQALAALAIGVGVVAAVALGSFVVAWAIAGATILIVIAVVGKLIEAFGFLWDHTKSLREAVISVFRDVGGAVQALYDNTIGPIIDKFEAALEHIKSIASEINDLTGMGNAAGALGQIQANRDAAGGGDGYVPPSQAHAIGGFLQPGENLVHQDEIVDRDTGRVTPAAQARKQMGGQKVQHIQIDVHGAHEPVVTAYRLVDELERV